MKVKEIQAKSVLSRSKVFDYTLNPYIGCAHGCRYCYAKFIKRFTGHQENWGEFVDVKINAPELLAKEIKGKKPGRVWVSGICDPYQPLEKKYQLTRRCLAILIENGWPITVQTKSPLVLRDLDLLKKGEGIEVCFTITTADERIREIFEPHAPPISARLNALEKLHTAGIRTSAMIAPLLPGAEELAKELKGKVDSVLIDRMNYHYADETYRKSGLNWAKTDQFFTQKGRALKESLEKSR